MIACHFQRYLQRYCFLCEVYCDLLALQSAIALTAIVYYLQTFVCVRVGKRRGEGEVQSRCAAHVNVHYVHLLCCTNSTILELTIIITTTVVLMKML